VSETKLPRDEDGGDFRIAPVAEYRQTPVQLRAFEAPFGGPEFASAVPVTRASNPHYSRVLFKKRLQACCKWSFPPR